MNIEKQIAEIPLLKYAFVAAPYATGVSFCYLLGYWGTFGIQIFSYIALSELVKFAIAQCLFVLIFAISISSMLFMSASEPDGSDRKAEAGSLTLSPRVSKWLGFLGLVITFLVLTFADEKSGGNWFLGSLVLAATTAMLLQDTKPFRQRIRNDTIRYGVALLLVLPLLGSLGVGKSQALSVIDGTQTYFVNAKVLKDYGTESFDKKHLFDGQEKLKFIGTVNDNVFLISLDNTKVYVVKFSDLHFLELSY